LFIAFLLPIDRPLSYLQSKQARGRSTSLFMLAGIYLPSGGELLFDGHVVNKVEARDRNIGIVVQSYARY
jgi:ABC-type sugar transport system ATPase subunit